MRDDDGKLGIRSATIYPGTDLPLRLGNVVPLEQLEALSSITSLTVELQQGASKVDFGPGIRSAAQGGNGGNGGSGKGWIDGAGTSYKLSAIWDQHATEEDRLQYEAAKGSGTKQYTVKKAVAKANGYTLAT